MNRWLCLSIAILIVGITLALGRLAFAQAAQPQTPVIISGVMSGSAWTVSAPSSWANSRARRVS